MTEEAIQQTQETEQQAEADFNQGFSKAPEQSAPDANAEVKTGDATAKDAETVTGDSAAKEVKAEVPAEKPALIAGMTEADWNAAVAKAAGPLAEKLQADIRKNFGQIGEMNRVLQEVKQGLSAGRGPGRKITADLLKRVNEELPGLGDALAQDLSAILGGAEEAQANAEAKGQSFNAEDFYAKKVLPALQEAEARQNERAELRIVKSIHRDFDTVVKSPEFGAWVKTLPADRQKEVLESKDGFVAADAVTEFKSSAEKAKKDQQKKSNRLEAAVTPRGVPNAGAPSTDEDPEAEFNSGFKKAGRKFR